MSRIKESVLLKCVFPVADLVMGTCAMKWYRQIVRMSTWSAQDIKDWQTRQMQELIKHAYTHTRYYRELMDEIGLVPEDIRSLEDLRLFPVLNRETIKQRYNDIIPDNINRYRYRKCTTGGSTREPLKYICDENTWGFVTAMKIYSWKKTGYLYGDCYVSLGSSSLFPTGKKNPVNEAYFKLRNTIPLNGMNMDDDTCGRYMHIIKEKGIRYIYGYASAINLLAKYCRDTGFDWHIDAVFTTAEKLTDIYRQVISETWDTTVMDCYGSRDGGITGYEIEPGRYHVGYSTWLEASNDSPSELYATNLIDFAFPTIRYSNKDEVMMWDDTVESRYNGQLIKEIIGRTSDVLTFDNGHRLTTSGFTILFRGFNVEAFRIKKTGSNSVLVQIQKREGYSEQEHQSLFSSMKRFVGEDVDVTFEYVERFAPLPNGKRSFMMNE